MSKNFFEIKNVDFRVGNKTKVKNVSFSIENEGDIICLLGPSGIGKTTILRTIAGLENINKGSIELRGKTLSSEKTCPAAYRIRGRSLFRAPEACGTSSGERLKRYASEMLTRVCWIAALC